MRRNTCLPLVLWLAAQMPLNWAVHSYFLVQVEHSVQELALWIGGVMAVEWFTCAWVGRGCDLGFRHPLPLLAALGAPLLLIIPGQTWLPLVLAGSAYYADLIIFVLVREGISPL